MSGAQEAPSVFLRVAAITATGVFRRAGFVFEKTPRVIACTPSQAAAIRAESKRTLIVHDSTEEELHNGPRTDADLLAEASAANASLGAKLDAALAEIAEAAKANTDAVSRISDLEAQLAKANADASARIAELEAQNKHLSAVYETNASELAKAHEAGRVLAARAAELEAQLAKANADLDALTAPKSDAKLEADAPKSKPAKG